MQRFQDTYRVDSIRLPDHDYAAPGWYFVTICTRDRIPFFGQVRGGVMGLSPAGCIAAREWQKTARLRPRVRLDAFVVMPNHVHGLIGLAPETPDAPADDGDPPVVETLRRNVSTTKKRRPRRNKRPGPKNERMAAISPDAGSLPVIVRAYKSIVTRRIRRAARPDFGWQSRFWDRVVRGDAERCRGPLRVMPLRCIRRYIRQNPQQWARDRDHPERRPR